MRARPKMLSAAITLLCLPSFLFGVAAMKDGLSHAQCRSQATTYSENRGFYSEL